MDLPFFCLFMLFILSHGLALNECKQSRCRKNGPAIRFPFRLKNQQPEHCGFPGFDLSCTETRDTLLELPNSVKLNVDRIDYVYQVIHTSDPSNCLPKQIINFNLSNSAFKFGDSSRNDYAFFNCTSIARREYLFMPCLSVPGYDVHAFYKDSSVDTLALTSCKKLYNLSSVPWELISGHNVLQLNWSRPACGVCEELGKHCRFKNNSTKLETECFDKPKPSSRVGIKLMAAGIAVGVFLLLVMAFMLYRNYNSDKEEKQNQARVKKFLEDYKALKPTRFSYADIKRITNRFKDNLGQGAYGTVFKGKLSNEISVAVKILTISTTNGEDFINEVGTMVRLHHVNVVRLVGFCADGFRRALVYEYLPNDSLEKFITSNGDELPLGWEKLQDIALGIAKGIEYLHQGCDQRILHFDIKPHNILLDENFNPKISDFGLSKLCAKDQSIISMTTARGTMGYIAPEVFSRNFGNVSYKSDIYSFGMVLLDMVKGRKNIDFTDENQVYFPEWVYNRLDQGEELRIRIKEDKDEQIAKKLIIVGLWCIQWNPVDRPSMNFVVQMVEGDGSKLTMPPNPFASAGDAFAAAGRFPVQKLGAISELEDS
ncbi:rust resistance kinase Lr10-like [Euphorbia lathyris]|uniref:rust resistance kinase Lr10-like n=1 Tax=Euphorbia lathyris TaxID=212925 RepID=UPI00331327AC